MLKNITNIFFLGIGGIGMSALARWMYKKGFTIKGWDDNPNTDLIHNILNEGISVFSSNIMELNNIANWTIKNSLVIYTPAISNNHKCLRWFQNKGFKIHKRSELLRVISEEYKVIAISGTHGKTTISTMLAHILKFSGINCNAFLGGISKNYNSNLLIGDSNIMVVEADEYDKSFLKLNPYISLISSLDKDHCDIYQTKSMMIDAYNEFIKRTQKLVVGHNKLGCSFDYRYSMDMESDFGVQNVRQVGGALNFEIYFPDKKIIKTGLLYSSYYNIENAIGAASIAYLLGVKPIDIGIALGSFLGVRRRLDYHVNNENLILIDDYAHHPEELKALIQSLRLLYKKKEIFLIFQPHLFSRTKEFESEFVEVLSLVDKLILIDIYGAREEPIAGISSKNILKKIQLKNKWYCNKNIALGLQQLDSILVRESPNLLITVGAGDIDNLIPRIKSIFI